jgi:hypothetical protein
VNILNKQSQIANRVGPLAWRFVEGLKNTACYEMLHSASDLDGSFGTI